MDQKYDAILIPGGGIKEDGSLPEWVKKRLEKAISLFTGNEYIITLSAGTTYKPHPLDDKLFSIYESVVCAKYLQERGIPKQNIFTETVSLDTIGNAYFVRVIHTDPGELRRLCIVTSEFHMPRTRAIFEWVFSLEPLKFPYLLAFEESPNEDIDEDILLARRKKEAKSLEQFFITKKSIKNLKELHTWIYTEHIAYATGLKRNTLLDNKLLNSY